MNRTQCSYLLIVISVTFNCVLCTVVNWGGPCEYTAECGDHRLVCEEKENSLSKICVCDRYHRWNGTVVGCVQKLSAVDILDMLNEKYNVAERIENEANIVFLAQVIAGLLVMAIGFTCAISVTIYCYHMWKTDTELDELVRHMSQRNKERQGTSRLAAEA